MITNSVIRIYSDPTCETLVSTFTDTSIDFHEIITGLTAGTQYYATVQSEDSLGQLSAESPAYGFTTLPQVNFTGYVTRDDSGFVRSMNNTTTDVQVVENGICWDTNSSFTTPTYTPGTTVSGLTENTTYYYRPYCIDSQGRRWVNTSDTDSVTTLYSIPRVYWNVIYGADATSFSARISIESLATVSQVVAAVTTNGVTTNYPLTAQTGYQTIAITGLSPETSYTIQIKATNIAGVGESTIESFTTQEASQGITVTLVRPVVSNVNNEMNVTSIASYSQDISLVSHSIEIYTNDQHTGAPVDSDTDTTDSLSSTFTGLLVDTTYWVFGKVEYTVGSDSTVLTEWSDPEEIHTYTFMSFGVITATQNGASIPFTVQGTASQVEVEYSIDNVNWTSIPVSDPTGETLVLSGLSAGTTYYVRGRAENQGGWQEYVDDTFSTVSVPSITITGISNITSSGATVNVQINQ